MAEVKIDDRTFMDGFIALKTPKIAPYFDPGYSFALSAAPCFQALP
jgi:hypothetical protein